MRQAVQGNNILCSVSQRKCGRIGKKCLQLPDLSLGPKTISQSLPQRLRVFRASNPRKTRLGYRQRRGVVDSRRQIKDRLPKRRGRKRPKAQICNKGWKKWPPF